jgi:hypothetical protein
MADVIGNLIRAIGKLLGTPVTLVDRYGEADSCLDDLAVREAIIGRGLVLTETDSDEPESGLREPESGPKDLLLHAVDAGHVSPIGVFRGAADAWEAIDAIDDAEAGRPSRARIRTIR